MARYTGPVCRLCRREGAKLYLKGDRCYSDKCAFARRSFAPGQHGQGRKKVSYRNDTTSPNNHADCDYQQEPLRHSGNRANEKIS